MRISCGRNCSRVSTPPPNAFCGYIHSTRSKGVKGCHKCAATRQAGAAEHQIQNVKGHRLVGGMRASVYNAVTMEDVQALATYMKDFEAQHSLSPRSN